MVAKIFAVIGMENHERVLLLPGLFQIIQHPSNLLVNQIDHCPVRRRNHPVIVIGHFIIRHLPRRVIRSDVIFLLEYCLVFQFARLIVRQRNLVENL